MNAQQMTAWEEATHKFKVTNVGASMTAVYVNAEAGTGSRYTVVVSKLPLVAQQNEGGALLISLLQPRQASMVFTAYPGEVIHGDYVVEKLCKELQYGGDRAGVVLAVNEALKIATEAGVL